MDFILKGKQINFI